MARSESLVGGVNLAGPTLVLASSLKAANGHLSRAERSLKGPK